MGPLGNTYLLLFHSAFSQKYFYRFAEDIGNKSQKGQLDTILGKVKKKGQLDTLLGKVKNNNLNTKYSIEVNPEKFLDTKVIIRKGKIITEVNGNK